MWVYIAFKNCISEVSEDRRVNHTQWVNKHWSEMRAVSREGGLDYCTLYCVIYVSAIFMF